MIAVPVRFFFGPAHRVRLPISSGAERPLRGTSNGNCRPGSDIQVTQMIAPKLPLPNAL
jgi:hypothetical protein